MKSLTKKFGHRIKYLRTMRGYSQEQFAEKCGFARTYMSRIETGGANPSLIALEVLATALEVSLSQLLNFEEKDSESKP
nr:helix-turn-helix transcriptional regulator [Suttonella indologenes]